jgi:ribonuclease HII
VVKGDRKCFFIASASIIAKVVRDRMMDVCDRLYPQYGFSRHKGYGTQEHKRAIASYGPSPLHRRSFRGVREYLDE